MEFKLQMLWDKPSDKYSLFILVSVIIYSFLGTYLHIGFSKNPVYNWEDASLITTLVFSVILYFRGYFSKNKLFTGMDIQKLGLIGILILLIVTPAILLLAINMFKDHLFIDRCIVMLILFIVTIVLSWVDLQIGQNKNIKVEYSRPHHTIFYISDIPITVSSFILLIYAFILKYCGIPYADMDAFFSGAIAFQLLISLFIWAFADNITLIIANNEVTGG